MAALDWLLPWDSQPTEPQPADPNLGIRGLWLPTPGTLIDCAGNNSAPYVGAQSAATDRGLSLYTPSNGQYASVGGPVVYAPTTAPWSFAAWIRLRTFGGASRFKSLAYIRSDGTSTYAFEIFASNAAAYNGINIGAPNGWARQFTNAAFGVDVWTHIGVSYNGAGLGTAGNTRLYLNGELQSLSAAGAFGASGKSQRTQFSDNISNQQWEGDILSPVVSGQCWPAEFFRALYQNHWQVFAPLSIRVPESAGGANGNAAAAPAGVSLTAPLATATGTGSALASGAPAGSSLTAPTATASGSALASCAPADLALTAPTATATGTTAGNATATGDLAGLTLTAPTATASGTALASGALAGVTLTAPTGAASNAGNGTASGDVAGVTLTAPAATATGTAQAFASFMATVLTAPTATASGGSTGALTDAEFRQMYEWVNELALIHGLIPGSDLVVTPTARSAGAVSQTIGTAGTTVTVTRP